MIRSDGKFMIFILQALLEIWPGCRSWEYIGDAGNFLVHNDTRMADLDKLHNNKNHPHRYFTASGRCWQQTGIHGCYTLKPAKELLKIIQAKNPDRKFRIAKLVIEQKIEPVILKEDDVTDYSI